MNNPFFIGIGAARAGTTWLHDQLARHPEVWMPPVKEFHYFNVQQTQGRVNRYSKIHMMQRSKEYLGDPQKAFMNFAWDLHYFPRRRSDVWYERLFRPQDRQISGEFTPNYALLSEHEIQRIALKWPHLKIIFIMRDIVDRSCSHITKSRKHLPPEEQLRVLIRNKTLQQMNAYCEVLDRWGLSFVKTQIHVGFFDDILQAPQTFLDQICDFLGINRIEYTRTVRQNTRKTPELFPLTIKQEIVRLYQEDIHAAANRFGGHAVQWENKAVALLER